MPRSAPAGNLFDLDVWSLPDLPLYWPLAGWVHVGRPTSFRQFHNLDVAVENRPALRLQADVALGWLSAHPGIDHFAVENHRDSAVDRDNFVAIPFAQRRPIFQGHEHSASRAADLPAQDTKQAACFAVVTLDLE